jgi:hypothetical protein
MREYIPEEDMYSMVCVRRPLQPRPEHMTDSLTLEVLRRIRESDSNITEVCEDRKMGGGKISCYGLALSESETTPIPLLERCRLNANHQCALVRSKYQSLLCSSHGHSLFHWKAKVGGAEF